MKGLWGHRLTDGQARIWMWLIHFLGLLCSKQNSTRCYHRYMAFPLEWGCWRRKQRILNENDPQHMKSVLARGLEERRKDSPQPTWKVSPQCFAQAHIPGGRVYALFLRPFCCSLGHGIFPVHKTQSSSLVCVTQSLGFLGLLTGGGKAPSRLRILCSMAFEIPFSVRDQQCVVRSRDVTLVLGC